MHISHLTNSFTRFDRRHIIATKHCRYADYNVYANCQSHEEQLLLAALSWSWHCSCSLAQLSLFATVVAPATRSHNLIRSSPS